MHRHRLYLRSTPSKGGPKIPDSTWHGQFGSSSWPTRFSHQRRQTPPEQAGRAMPSSNPRVQARHRRDSFVASAGSWDFTGLRTPHAKGLHRAQLIDLIFAAIALVLPRSSRRQSRR